jgi:hydroxyacylglutathione hydrolase
MARMLHVTPINAFSDNYIWLIRGLADPTQVAVVDPGDAVPVLRYLREHHMHLAAILLTHHHADHVGGVDALLQDHTAPVFGPAREQIPGNPRRLREGDQVELPSLGVKFQVLDIPGHTAGHIAYTGHGALFCGDTLFSAGCGRLFEGTAEQMSASLAKLRLLDAGSLVYCGHEYTVSNLRFAETVEPGNSEVAAYLQRCRSKRALGEPTVPSTLALEHSVNPFLRCDTDTVKQAAEAHVGHTLDSTVEVFAAIRTWKDTFRPPA